MYTSSAYTTDLIRAFHDEEQIVSFLSDAISENTKEALRVEIDKNPLWLMLQHSHFGMYIRNLLREHGFSYHDFVMDEMRIIWFCARADSSSISGDTQYTYAVGDESADLALVEAMSYPYMTP